MSLEDKFFVHRVSGTQVRVILNYDIPTIKDGEWRIADFVSSTGESRPTMPGLSGKLLIKWLYGAGYREMTELEEAKFILIL